MRNSILDQECCSLCSDLVDDNAPVCNKQSHSSISCNVTNFYSVLCVIPGRTWRLLQTINNPLAYLIAIHLTLPRHNRFSVCHDSHHDPPDVFLFSLPVQEPEAKPQILTEDTEKKKPKKPKKMSNINSITGFEEVFQQFATSSIKTSKNAMLSHPEAGNLLTPRQSDIPADNKLDGSATQVRLFSFKLIRFVFWVVTSYCVQQGSTPLLISSHSCILLHKYVAGWSENRVEPQNFNWFSATVAGKNMH